MEVNSNASLSKCATTMALLPNRLLTSHNPQANAIIERVHKVVNEMLRSFDLEKQNLEEDNPFDYFL
jgi:hypothetical protein